MGAQFRADAEHQALSAYLQRSTRAQGLTRPRHASALAAYTTPLPATSIMSHSDAELLEEATKGFDLLFSNEIAQAMDVFTSKDTNLPNGEPSPFHLVGQGVCVFLEAAMGMEVCNEFVLLRRSSFIMPPRPLEWLRQTVY